MKQLQGFVRRAAALVLAAVLCLCAPAALAADDAAVSGGAVTMGGANTTLIPAEEENCLSWLFGSGDTITLPYLNIRGQGLKKNVTLNLVDCLVGITYNELGSIGSYVSASAAQQAWKAQAVAVHSYLEYHKQYGSSTNALVYTPVDQIPSAAREAIRKAVEPVKDEILTYNVVDHWDEIRAIIAEIPSAEELAALCEKLGAFYKPEQIGIDPALSEDMLSVSAAIRNRLTLIRMRRVLDFGE